MYYRIKNNFEMNLLHDIFLKSHVPEIVIDRMSEITDILDSNYGIQRSSTAMGGYLLFFPTKEDYNNDVPIIMHNYNIESNLFEYDDILDSTENINWREKLYLLSADDSLIFIYMQ